MFADDKEPPRNEWTDDGPAWEPLPAAEKNDVLSPTEVASGPRFVAFDLEIAVAVRGNDWKAQRPLGISCAATLTSDGDALLWHGAEGTYGPIDDVELRFAERMNPAEVQELAGYLLEMQAQGYTVVTWNGLGFDFDVLAEECQNVIWSSDVANLAMQHVDPYFQMFCERGYGIGLETAGNGLGVGQKTEGMHGDLAPVLWCGWPDWADDDLRQRIGTLGVEPGTRAAQNLCLEYVAQDAKLTADVYRAILTKMHLPWIARSGRSNTWHPMIFADAQDKRLLTVSESLDIPEPDTSWMSNPRKRSDMLAWIDGEG